MTGVNAVPVLYVEDEEADVVLLRHVFERADIRILSRR